MLATHRRRTVRALAAGAVTAALLSAGSAGALAADNAPVAKPSPMHTTMPMTKGSITVKANHTTVKAGENVVFAGHVKGVKTGTKLVLQHQHNGKWTTLHASTTVKKGGVFSLSGKLNTKGTEHLRVVTSDGRTHSSTTTVKVH
ncbi:hypothetical protein ABZ858_29030 [Streptomyces sp. NPDC047017]|uniref:hypothetical protein n=1 Tax=Streptomyces sp. NPDC047017 TaxID=3155024 RepID=UPI003410A1BA